MFIWEENFKTQESKKLQEIRNAAANIVPHNLMLEI